MGKVGNILVSAEYVWERNACWTFERLLKYFGAEGRKRLSTILRDKKGVALLDRMWVLHTCLSLEQVKSLVTHGLLDEENAWHFLLRSQPYEYGEGLLERAMQLPAAPLKERCRYWWSLRGRWTGEPTWKNMCAAYSLRKDKAQKEEE